MAAAARLVTGLGCALLSLRVAWVTWGEFAARGAPETPTARRSREVPDATPPVDEVPSLAPPASPRPPARQRTLWVRLGAPRSEVFVNGVRLGETPYAGDWSCADDELLSVTVVPPRGAPLERRLRCSGELLVVKDADPPPRSRD